MEITKWEYTTASAGDKDFNELGKQGWEAVATSSSSVLFKRPAGKIQVREVPAQAQETTIDRS